MHKFQVNGRQVTPSLNLFRLESLDGLRCTEDPRRWCGWAGHLAGEGDSLWWSDDWIVPAKVLWDVRWCIDFQIAIGGAGW